MGRFAPPAEIDRGKETMMKHSKIALRLILYFSAALLLFSLIVGGAFAFLSTRRTMKLHRDELQLRAETVAGRMYDFLSGTAQPIGSGHHGSGGSMSGTGFGAYLRYMGDFTMADVWVVDRDSKTITPGSEHHMAPIVYGELPPDGEEVIDRALAGEIFFSESFSGVLGERTLSVGVPIRKDEGSEPLGAVLLHTPVQGISDAIWDGLRTLLFSVLAALLLAVPAAILLSLKFTRPLNRMKDTADRIAEGNFSARNELAQKDEIGDLAAAMDQMAGRLAAASQESKRLEQMRQDFFSNISHELRTPVTVLRGSLEAVADGVVNDPAQVAEYQRNMLAESRNLQRLVEDLLELSRLQNADFKIEKAPLELRQLLEDAARSMRRLAEPKGVRLETSMEDGDFTFVGDYGRLRQMLVTVIDNAVKFSPQGGTVSLALSRQAGQDVISVTDHGPGIEPDQLPQIFERFHSSGAENPTGTGLGLPIAKQIAQRHGVKIRVESRNDAGNSYTRFTFLFPLEHPTG